jgi:hypothetical protein
MSDRDRELHDAMTEFLWAFETVFHHDWEYALTMLHPFNEMIGEGGTFLEPRVKDEASDWGNRALLLRRYRNLKALMEARGLVPPVISEEEAIRAAREALAGNVELSPGGGVEVARQDAVFIVIFTREDPPGTCGPVYDARVEVDACTGKVTDLYVPS